MSVWRNDINCRHISMFLFQRTLNDVIMGAIASKITSLTSVYSIAYSDADQRKHQSSAALVFAQSDELPAQMASYAENVCIWWRHHGKVMNMIKTKPMQIPSVYMPHGIHCADYFRFMLHHENIAVMSQCSLITRLMGPTWGQLGPTGPRWAPCRPHGPCHLGCSSPIYTVYEYITEHWTYVCR